MTPPRYFSRLGCIAASRGGNLPHWSQSCATFVTFRLGDSLPAGKLAQLQAEREEWLKAHLERRGEDSASTGAERRGEDSASTAKRRRGEDSASTGVGVCRRGVLTASGWSEAEEREYRELFSARLQRWLDAGHGSCVLREERIRQIVEDSLRHFADIRYSLYAYVVMPNHVHVLFMPEEGFDGRKIVADWKRFTAKAINAASGASGELWQKESYDHLVRDVAEFNAVRAYIRGNAPHLAYDAYSVSPVDAPVDAASFVDAESSPRQESDGKFPTDAVGTPRLRR